MAQWARAPMLNGEEQYPKGEPDDGTNGIDALQRRITRDGLGRAELCSRIKRGSSIPPPLDDDPSEQMTQMEDIFVPEIPVHVQEAEKSEVTAFRRITISATSDDHSEEVKRVCHRILHAAKLRRKYQCNTKAKNWGSIDPEKFRRRYEEKNASFRHRSDPPFVPFPDSEEDSIFTEHRGNVSGFVHTNFVDGVMQVEVKEAGRELLTGLDDEGKLPHPPSLQEFCDDLSTLLNTANDAACRSVCFKRLKLLESLFDLHVQLNADKENEVQRMVPHRDYYNVRKVDTHIHHSAIMNQKHLLRFIKHKLKKFPNEVVIHRDGKDLTLSAVFKSLSLTAYDLSIDTLDMHADSNTFHRFDRFNLKYNPVGESRLREIFLKTDNHVKGRYLAEITREVFNDCEANKYVMLEPRVSIYGRNAKEWSKLANWYSTNRLSSPNVRWMIQVPRLYSIYKKAGFVGNFQDMLTNIFAPLFEVTIDPTSDPDLDRFLTQMTGFDCVDDESKFCRAAATEDLPVPADWNTEENPPYFYWAYYIYANLFALNALRDYLNLSTFTFRPHAGEAGDPNNLAATFLCAHNINHGILLRKSPTLQYLYYLEQVGLAVSPLSNNRLFLEYQSNPFPNFFARGLNVSLSTDDPLMLHMTKDPLVEEYGVASQVWRLSSTDTCEIARNSVLQSGFEYPYKLHFLGESFAKGQNNIAYTNVPDVRIIYRQERLKEEWDFVNQAADHSR